MTSPRMGIGSWRRRILVLAGLGILTWITSWYVEVESLERRRESADAQVLAAAARLRHGMPEQEAVEFMLQEPGLVRYLRCEPELTVHWLGAEWPYTRIRHYWLFGFREHVQASIVEAWAIQLAPNGAKIEFIVSYSSDSSGKDPMVDCLEIPVE